MRWKVGLRYRQSIAVVDLVDDPDVVRVVGVVCLGGYPLVGAEFGPWLQNAHDLGVHVLELQPHRKSSKQHFPAHLKSNRAILS